MIHQSHNEVGAEVPGMHPDDITAVCMLSRWVDPVSPPVHRTTLQAMESGDRNLMPESSQARDPGRGLLAISG
jgi:hypothetical protein